MLSLAALALAAAQPAAPAGPALPAPPPVILCSPSPLIATPARAATLVPSDMTGARGPLIDLELAVTADEEKAFGKLAFIRLDGKPFAGGTLFRRIDDAGAVRFALPFDFDKLPLLSGGITLELVEQAGPGLSLTLAPAASPTLQECVTRLVTDEFTRSPSYAPRHFTFLALEPNQTLGLRTRGRTGDDYPAKALAEGREGITRIGVEIGTDGRIASCTVLVSSGHTDLDTASCRTARRSSFLPATDAKGEPVETKAEQNIIWKMAD